MHEDVPSIKTDAQLFAYVRSLGLVPSKVDGEYKVRIPMRPRCDYFTGDRQDAACTALAMHETERMRKPAHRIET